MASSKPRSLQWKREKAWVSYLVVSVLTFAVVPSFKSWLTFHYPCVEAPDEILFLPVLYPFKLSHHSEERMLCGQAYVRYRLRGRDLSAECRFFVAVGVITMLWSLACIFTDGLVLKSHRESKSHVMTELVAGILLVLLWMLATIPWTIAVTALLKDVHSDGYLSARNWDGRFHNEKVRSLANGGFLGLTVSVFLGFLNVLCWAELVWHEVKELKVLRSKEMEDDESIEMARNPCAGMAKLVSVVRDENCFQFDRRQLPLRIDDNLMMIMQVKDSSITSCAACDRAVVKPKDVDKFLAKYEKLNAKELEAALKVSSHDLFRQLAASVPCVGCRRSVERLFTDLRESGYPALEPVVVTNDACVVLSSEFLCAGKSLASLFQVHGSKLGTILKGLLRSKKTQRCVLHSLDVQRARPLNNWLEVWDSMSRECRDAVVQIQAEMLQETLEAYLRKHRFCLECRSKVLRAYSILVGDADPSKEKGYLPSLYEGIRICPPPDKHIHVQASPEFIDALIARAEPELMGNNLETGRRERHAKTIEIAQEEVLTCLGICLYERLHKIQQRTCEEELTWELLFCISLEVLQKNFELAVEKKLGISQLELICQEMEREEQEKQQRKEQKRLRKKQKKQLREKKPNECSTGDASVEASASPSPASSVSNSPQTTLKAKKVEEEGESVVLTAITTPVIRRRSDGSITAMDPPNCVLVTGFDHPDDEDFEPVKSRKTRQQHAKKQAKNQPKSPRAESLTSTTRRKRGNRGRRGGASRSSATWNDQKRDASTAVVHDGSWAHVTAASATKARTIVTVAGPESVVDRKDLVSVPPKDDFDCCSSCISSACSNDIGSSEGSDACSEGFCNHKKDELEENEELEDEKPDFEDASLTATGNEEVVFATLPKQNVMDTLPLPKQHCPMPGYLSLLDQIDDDDGEDFSDAGESLIPPDEIRSFERLVGGKVEEKRAKLREDLKKQFARLCGVSDVDAFRKAAPPF
ncbi:unnamed protein product [Notodromas monacha]|uniref:Gametogenetin-binding protein 2 n=1 Tax=Notodromas monacha TaxID=399045 RepID=A0A7R9GB52_9CRUS|nr:unnamed protein product [Notodromas monacha]CAG0914439.1 unnamed protein product [Notodromas monacha]